MEIFIPLLSYKETFFLYLRFAMKSKNKNGGGRAVSIAAGFFFYLVTKSSNIWPFFYLNLFCLAFLMLYSLYALNRKHCKFELVFIDPFDKKATNLMTKHRLQSYTDRW